MNIFYIKPNIFYLSKALPNLETNTNNCKVIVIDNFYDNPFDVRNFALSKRFFHSGNFPGYRTQYGFANEKLYCKIQEILKPYRLQIFFFEMLTSPNFFCSNGSFTLSNAKDTAKGWVHKDGNYSFKKVEDTAKTRGHKDDNLLIKKDVEHWSAIVYLTPNAPIHSGTSFYELDYDKFNIFGNNNEIKYSTIYTRDLSKFILTDTINNIFNRIIIFNADKYHAIDLQFGKDMHDSRLTQNFFFTCKKY